MTEKNFDYWRGVADRALPQAANLIDGAFVAAESGATFAVISPIDGAELAQFPRSAAADTERAVDAAHRAFRSGVWSRLAPRDRAAIISRFADLIEENAERFSALDTIDMGKPVSLMTEFDLPDAIGTFRYLAECIDKVEGAVTATDPGALHYMLRQPLGVVGCITPWNFPLAMASWKVAPALAAGNTVVLKPAEQSPLSAALMGELFLEAGGPPGVFNIIHGFGEEAAKPLALHNKVDKISFTGSAAVGKLMFRYAGESNMKHVSTECGGKTPQIIFADVPDLDQAVEYAANGIFGNQGEVCNAGSRILVHADIHDEFVRRFEKFAAEAFRPGHPLDPNTGLGPMVDRQQRETVEEYLTIGEGEGAKLHRLAEVPDSLVPDCYLPPMYFSGVGNDMRIAQEEIFGPVACIMPFTSAREALAVANDSLYGLAASVWTGNLRTAHLMARDLEAGIVWVNCFDHLDMTMPWGGWKQSGNGRDKCFQALLDHTQSKSVWIDLPGELD